MWEPPTPIERHVAAADLWMELTGRKHASSPETDPSAPRLSVPTAVGGAAGATLGGAGGALLSHATKGSKLKGGVGGAVIGAGAGAATGLGVGVKRLSNYLKNKHEKQASVRSAVRRGFGAARKWSPTTKALVGAGLGAIPAVGIAGTVGYQRAKARRGGKSKDELDRELALARLIAGKEQLHRNENIVDSVRQRYAEMALSEAKKNKEHPLRAAALHSILPAAAGAVGGAGIARILLR